MLNIPNISRPQIFQTMPEDPKIVAKYPNESKRNIISKNKQTNKMRINDRLDSPRTFITTNLTNSKTKNKKTQAINEWGFSFTINILIGHKSIPNELIFGSHYRLALKITHL